jgi:predicted Holliday junction resolvase-like endonuclease
LNFLLEIALLSCIIFLVYLLYTCKKKILNADSLDRENSFLKNQLTQLQSSFAEGQNLLKQHRIELEVKEKTLTENCLNLESQLNEEVQNRKKILSQKKSSEVRLGSIAETLAPFLDQFDFNPEECTFLGKPIDYISFGDDEITFIEIKSGNSQLSSKQRHIRDQVKAKLVSWKEVKIK